ncbi:MAG TPA: sulfite exporter TauE/SafE family protein [Burkholderiaceae bacterium]|jgi:uncharacterized membrane protein YfcA|nr:sulfite exporter TauE/SafE family protein [Burkholderiaceae bacterium]HRA77745.1 sulfite exporter TauE/SafE family protein [Burkholderiaceae bacterium]
MSGAELLLSSLAALLIGALIGSVGIGGVLMVPWLTQVIGLPIRDAVAIAMLGFVATGAAAAIIAARSVRDPATMRWPLVVATVPGALLGAAAIASVPERAALLVLALGLCIVGVRMLRTSPAGREPRDAGADARHSRAGWGVGLLTGFASSLTGTGGPMVLTPLLAWRGVPLLDAILLGQLVQLPIATTATLAHAVGEGVDWVAGAALGLMLVPGVFAGRRLAGAMPVAAMTRLLGAMLLVTSGGLALDAL